jgi:hypothetical protein
MQVGCIMSKITDLQRKAKVAELADAPDLGSGGETPGGSSPPFRTNNLQPLVSFRRFHCAHLIGVFRLGQIGF